MDIKEKIKLLPHNYGVYLFKDEANNIIYVGKSKDLKKRVSQYFQSSSNHNAKTVLMVSKIADLDYVVVNTEADALLLENNLIKEHQPRYNILLKDGKTYPWICISNEVFPKVFLSRSLTKDNSSYYGPYSSNLHAKSLLEIINSLYKIRTCNHKYTLDGVREKKFKSCLNYHIERCYAPCISAISEKNYLKQIEEIIEILKGNTSKIIKRYEDLISFFSNALEFEKAQEIKEKSDILKKHYSKSLIVSAEAKDMDVFTLVFDGNDAYGNFLRLKNGCITQSLNLEMKTKLDEEESSVLSFFMKQVYVKIGGMADIPTLIYAPLLPDDEYLRKRVVVPQIGDKRSLLELSRKNAAELRYEKLKYEEFTNPNEHINRILENVKKDLQLPSLPIHIECFDNSNIQGTNPVGACVVFRNASPAKKDYRHFNIKTVEGANDFASMEEIVTRRYSRLLQENSEDLPQLIVIDGGKGQVSSAFTAIFNLGLVDRIKIIGIAKRLEEIIVPGDPIPLFLDKNSSTLKLIMRMRDEAHRFGITHHRKRRSKSQLISELDSIPGVGVKSKEKLIEKYKTITLIKKTKYAEIKELIGKKSADALFTYLGKPNS